MNDQVPPEKRTHPENDSGRELYGDQIQSAITHLGKPKPELLWVLLLVIVIEGAQLWEHSRRVETSSTLLAQIISHTQTIEQHRSEELRRAQEAIEELARTVSRVSEQTQATIEGVLPKT